MAIRLFYRETITSSKIYQYLYSFSDCKGSVDSKPAYASGHLMRGYFDSQVQCRSVQYWYTKLLSKERSYKFSFSEISPIEN